MADGPAHFNCAIEIIDGIARQQRDGEQILVSEAIACAQVHATLALAAAVAMSHDGNMRISDSEAWIAAASAYRPVKSGSAGD